CEQCTAPGLEFPKLGAATSTNHENWAALCARLGPPRAGRNWQQASRKNRTQSAPGLALPELGADTRKSRKY
ncbi:hypothetical protein A2U01_0062851, partial [Trifolium medium]|nr:hypothetical protein [Trifolium medium]